MFKDILTFASRNLIFLIPLTILFALFVGYFIDTSSLKKLLLPVVVLMIYPAMIGFNLHELADLSEKKLIVLSLIINFVLVPVIGYLLGLVFLIKNPELFAGLVIVSLVPTASMTIPFTLFAKGNVKASIKITVLCLILSSFLAPWYLYFIVGRYVPVDIWLTFKTIGIVVFLPLLMGILTFKYLQKRYTDNDFNTEIKPLLPGISAWGALFIIFTAISMNSKLIFNNPNILAVSVFVQAVFYLINYFLVTTFSKLSNLSREDSYALIYSTVLRNLAISIGLATIFGTKSVFIVSLAFLFQPQSALWFAKLNEKYHFLSSK